MTAEQFAEVLDRAMMAAWAETVISVDRHGHEADYRTQILNACLDETLAGRERTRMEAIAWMRSQGLQVPNDFGAATSLHLPIEPDPTGDLAATPAVGQA